MSTEPRTDLFESDHEVFRESVRAFLAGEVAPSWPDGAALTRAAEQGIGSIAVPEEYGGGGVDDPRFEAVVTQESLRLGLTAFAVISAEHAEAARFIARHGTDELSARWLPGLAVGQHRAALADGSRLDSAGMLFDVAGGATASLVVADLGQHDDGSDRGVAVVDLTSVAVTRSPVTPLGVVGIDAADLEVPDAAAEVVTVLPEVAPELRALRSRVTAVLGVAGARTALEATIAYVNERQVFSTPVAAFGNTRRELASLAADVAAGEALVADLLRPETASTRTRAALGALRAIALHDAAVDLGLQLHGGYGYMLEYPISRAFADARYLRLHAGLEALAEQIAPEIGLVRSAARV